MRRLVGLLLTATVAVGMVLSNCTPAATAEFPVKGKPIALIVPFAAGGGTDIASRLLAALMEKDLGAPVQIVNKPGAGSQIGVTALVTSKPDGYTIGVSPFPHIICTYMDPDRKAVFTRKSFEPIGFYMVNPVIASVAPNSPYKTLKELVDAAKANPGKIKIGHTGGLSSFELGMLMFQKVAGIQLAPVQFDGGAPILTATLGGHIDISLNITPEVAGFIKGGQVRALGVMDKEESKFLPGVKTFESQGYPVKVTSPVGLSAPAGTPKEIVAVLAGSMKKAVATTEWKSKMDELGFTMMNPDPAEYAATWGEWEIMLKPLVEMAKQQRAK
jgi:tripartite-type tricarboxylate transporter receptor subunit TctC